MNVGFGEGRRASVARSADVGQVLETTLGATLRWDSVITTDHNHVSLEEHGGRDLWIHRKGAMPMAQAEP